MLEGERRTHGHPEVLSHLDSANRIFRTAAAVGVYERGGCGHIETGLVKSLGPRRQNDLSTKPRHWCRHDSAPMARIKSGPAPQGIENDGPGLVVVDYDMTVLQGVHQFDGGLPVLVEPRFGRHTVV